MGPARATGSLLQGPLTIHILHEQTGCSVYVFQWLGQKPVISFSQYWEKFLRIRVQLEQSPYKSREWTLA